MTGVQTCALPISVASDVPDPRGSWWLAAILAVLLVAALRLHSVLRRPAPDDISLTHGLSPQLAHDIALITLLFSLVVAWTLGWPILAATLAFLAAARLSRDPLWTSIPWTSPLFRALGAASLALAGTFFMAQNARLSVLALVLMALSALHRLGVEFLWKSGSRS